MPKVSFTAQPFRGIYVHAWSVWSYAVRYGMPSPRNVWFSCCATGAARRIETKFPDAMRASVLPHQCIRRTGRSWSALKLKSVFANAKWCCSNFRQAHGEANSASHQECWGEINTIVKHSDNSFTLFNATFRSMKDYKRSLTKLSARRARSESIEFH